MIIRLFGCAVEVVHDLLGYWLTNLFEHLSDKLFVAVGCSEHKIELAYTQDSL